MIEDREPIEFQLPTAKEVMRRLVLWIADFAEPVLNTLRTNTLEMLQKSLGFKDRLIFLLINQMVKSILNLRVFQQKALSLIERLYF